MEQEISLRDIIEIIWNGKWVIILVTLFVMIATGIYNFFFIDPTYEARVTLSVNSNSVDGNGISLPKYTEQVKSHQVMRATIQELQLGEEGITINSLRDHVRTEIIKDTNLIRIHVKDSNADKASQIANSVSKHFILYVKNHEIEQIIASLTYEINNLDTDINVQKNAMDKTQQELEKTPQFIEINKTLSEDPFLHSVASGQTSRSSAETGALRYSEEVLNPAYETLLQSATNLQIAIQGLESRKIELQSKIEQRNIEVKEYVLVASPAIPPEKPIAPRKAMNVAVAGVASGMISLFIVFLMHYWRNSGTNMDKKEQNLTITA